MDQIIASAVPAEIAVRRMPDTTLDKHYLEVALQEIVDTVTTWGEYPAQANSVTRKFSLNQWLYERMDAGDLADAYTEALLDFSGQKMDRSRRGLESDLRRHFENSRLVQEVAERMAEEA